MTSFDPVAVLGERFVRAIREVLPEAPETIDPLIGPEQAGGSR